MTDAELNALQDRLRRLARGIVGIDQDRIEAADAIAALREQVAALQKGDDMYYIRKWREADADNAALREKVETLQERDIYMTNVFHQHELLFRQRALQADNAALRQDAERLDWLDLQADDWTYKGSKVWKIVGPKLSIREVIDSVRPMRQDDDAMREGKE